MAKDLDPVANHKDHHLDSLNILHQTVLNPAHLVAHSLIARDLELQAVLNLTAHVLEHRDAQNLIAQYLELQVALNQTAQCPEHLDAHQLTAQDQDHHNQAAQHLDLQHHNLDRNPDHNHQHKNLSHQHRDQVNLIQNTYHHKIMKSVHQVVLDQDQVLDLSHQLNLNRRNPRIQDLKVQLRDHLTHHLNNHHTQEKHLVPVKMLAL